jgi:hypothetical protein
MQGFRHHSPDRYDQTAAKDARDHKGKRHDSSDSSLLQPAYERAESPRRKKAITAVEDISEEETRHTSKNQGKKHKKPEALSLSSDDSQSESHRPQRIETFEKRSRRKTREDRYESKKKSKHVVEENKTAKKKTIKVKRGDAAKASRKAGEDLINSFRSKNVAQDRLTV